jgi:hypothetical protein
MTKLGRRERTRNLASKASVLLFGALGVLALANESGERLDGSGFTVRAAQNQAAAQHERGDMWLTEGDEGFSGQREYALNVLIVQPEAQQRFSRAQGLGERLER